jgi:hypothetical protein
VSRPAGRTFSTSIRGEHAGPSRAYSTRSGPTRADGLGDPGRIRHGGGLEDEVRPAFGRPDRLLDVEVAAHVAEDDRGLRTPLRRALDGERRRRRLVAAVEEGRRVVRGRARISRIVSSPAGWAIVVTAWSFRPLKPRSVIARSSSATARSPYQGWTRANASSRPG